MEKIKMSEIGNKTQKRRRMERVLAPLIERLEEYDRFRIKLEIEGGSRKDISEITRLLVEPISMRLPGDGTEARLVEHANIRQRLRRFNDFNIHFDLRVLQNGMPVYYLCRTKEDFWANYTYIVEDIYRSPGYPLPDDRFCRLMEYGKERYFLRLSQLREGVSGLEKNPYEKNSPDQVDDFLHAMGKHVLQSAWHEDQLSGIRAAELFGLGRMKEAIELLYLCLGGDLCGLRAHVDRRMLDFFETVYPQKAIRSFLGSLKGIEGSGIGEIQERALANYALLSVGFSRFLSTEVKHGGSALGQPLYKLVFGNFYRLENMKSFVAENPGLDQACERLELTAGDVIEAMTARRSVAFVA